MHADRNKEQTEQDIAKRLDVFFDLIAKLGFGNQHAGHKSAQLHRQPELLGQPGKQQSGQQHIQREHFVRALPRHQRKPAPHQRRPETQQDGQQTDRLEQRQGQIHPPVLIATGQRRDQDQQRDDGQILKQQHAEHALPMIGFEFAPFGQQFADQGGRAHGHRATDGNRRAPVHATRKQQHEPSHRHDHQRPETDRHGGADLSRPQPEHMPFERHEFGQREFESEREHQKHDADFAQTMRGFCITGQARRMRADHHPHRQIGDQRRRAKGAQRNHRNNRGSEEDER